MRTNTDLTVYNKSIDPVTRGEVWTRNQVKGANWQNRKAANVLRSGLLEADSAAIYIPFTSGDDYLKPRAWEALADKSGKWTLRVGDVLVKGLVDDDIGAGFTISDLERKYDDVVSIRSVDTMDAGSLHLQHWQVGAK